MPKPMSSGQLAKQAGVNVETLRYYEREGLLPVPQRTDSGYRQYRSADVQQVVFIKRAQDLGFTLKEIKELLALRVAPEQSAQQVKTLAQEKLTQIDAKIQALQAMKTALADLVAACPGSEGNMAHCPIIQCFESPTPNCC
jgi:MerR family copper efflux transcriptional regulator